MERGYPDIRYALAAGAIFISNISTSVTVFDDSCEKSCMSVGKSFNRQLATDYVESV